MPKLKSNKHILNIRVEFTQKDSYSFRDVDWAIRVEDIKTKKEVHDERSRCEGHVRYQVRKLERNFGLKLQAKVVSRSIIDGGYVEVYVTNMTMKPGVGYSGGGGTVNV